MNFPQAYSTISKLVIDFKENEKIFLNPSYSEADVRNDFINKFFIALGWDVRHELQKNPYEQEVRVEKPVQVAKAQKRADYTFYFAPNFRDVKFFVEAKKPSHDLINKDYFFQTVRYGWNATTPIAVLTDFEEFIILDSRFRPDINDILNYKIKSFHYSDYANEEKFREIYYLFSREAVAENSIEKFADALPKPRGKAVQRGLFKGGFQSIDEAFLEELDEIRNSLAKSFKKNNSHLTSEQLTEATQRTIDRLVFIKFLEDKMIEPHHYVSEFGNRKSAWEDFLVASRTLDAKYNGIVFKKTSIDSRNIVEPDEKTFSSVCEGLSHDNTPYNFDAIPIHILGSIYERFLGKVVNATDKRVTIEEKPEVRKAGGVYYTPQYIVNYIVDNTIVKLIDGKTPKEIAGMRFADIACGSGSFLITVYEKLIDYHKKWYQEHPAQAKKEGCILFEDVYRLSLQQKQKILINNIYGVDLDQQAVEVTQLSLYLKLLEDETTATANDTWVMFKEKLLPDLNKNIICGNSLIGTDIFDGQLFDYEEEHKLKPMNFEDVFPKIMNDGGFDAIVGNPPYITYSLGKGKKHEENSTLKYLVENYQDSSEYKVNSFALFYDRATKKVKKNGIVAFIVPGTILINKYLSKIRKHLINHFELLEIVSLKYKVFCDAEMGDCAVLFIKNSISKNYKINYKEFFSNNWQSPVIKELESKKILELPNARILTNDLIYKILVTNKFKYILLGDVVKFYNGIKTGDNKKFISEIKNTEKHLPAIRGRDFNRYCFPEPHIYVLFDTKKLWSNFDENKLRVKGKILIRQTSDTIIATIDDKGFLCLDTVHIIYESLYNMKYIVGIVNSRLFNYIHQLLVPEFGKAFAEVKIANLFELPIPRIESLMGSDNKVISLVDQMFASKIKLKQAKTESEKDYLERKCASLDKQIDEIVYKLYGLTEEEIRIVEGE